MPCSGSAQESRQSLGPEKETHRSKRPHSCEKRVHQTYNGISLQMLPVCEGGRPKRCTMLPSFRQQLGCPPLLCTCSPTWRSAAAPVIQFKARPNSLGVNARDRPKGRPPREPWTKFVQAPGLCPTLVPSSKPSPPSSRLDWGSVRQLLCVQDERWEVKNIMVRRSSLVDFLPFVQVNSLSQGSFRKVRPGSFGGQPLGGPFCLRSN